MCNAFVRQKEDAVFTGKKQEFSGVLHFYLFQVLSLSICLVSHVFGAFFMPVSLSYLFA